MVEIKPETGKKLTAGMLAFFSATSVVGVMVAMFNWGKHKGKDECRGR